MGTPPDPTPRPDGAAPVAPRASLAGRVGYDACFLGPEVPLPLPTDPGVETVVLPYTNFSVVFRPDRRLAAVAAVVIDGGRLVDAPSTADWRFDPRLPENRQAGELIYQGNPLDKGHLVRRIDPVWGLAQDAATADSDTFHYTNAAPQMETFNRGKQLWQGLENYLLDHAERFDRRLAVFTGAVLEESDPPYRGIQVPLRYWKVAAFLQDGALASTGYVLDQSPDLSKDAADRARREAAARGGLPPLGAFRTFQVPVADLTRITGLDLGPLPAADRLPSRVRAADRWTRLEAFGDIAV